MPVAEARGVALGEVTVRITFLMRDGWDKAEMRWRINKKLVVDYARDKRENHAKFPPPVVFFDVDTDLYWVGDGFHRIEADAMNGELEIEVDLKRGGEKEAILWNLESNQKNNANPVKEKDKGHAAKVMLKSPLFADWSHFRIAQAIGCSRCTVGRLARIIGVAHNAQMRTDVSSEKCREMREAGYSNGEIAKKNGCSKTTVKNRLNRGNPCSSTRNRPDVTPEIVCKLYQDGLTLESIASNLSCSTRTVRNKLGKSSLRCPTCHGTGYVLAPAATDEAPPAP